MDALSYTLAGDGTLHVHVEGVSKAVRSDASNYQPVMTALREKRWEDVSKLIDPLKDIDEASDKVEVCHGVVTLIDDDGERFDVPSVLGEEITRYTSLGLDFDRLTQFAKNLNLNPSYHSVQQLFGWIKQSNLTLTEDGHFIAYKGVNANWTDCYTGKMNNSIGKVVKMPRNKVNEDCTESCAEGLHVATYDYAHANYGSGGRHVVAVKVHPKDVVAVPEGEYEKMRTCEYLVLEESFAQIKRPDYEGTDGPEPADACCHDEDGECQCDTCGDCGEYDCQCEDVWSAPDPLGARRTWSPSASPGDGCAQFESDCCCDDDYDEDDDY